MDDLANVAVLVEGESDRQAVLATAAQLDRDLAVEGVLIIAMGGATNIDRYVDQYGPRGLDLELAGMCDVGERRHFERVLAGEDIFVCDIDLEDELIRALGHDEMIEFIKDQGELKTFRTFQKQPAQRDRSLDEHLHRFCGIRSGRKVRYGREIAARLGPNRTPEPLLMLLSHL